MERTRKCPRNDGFKIATSDFHNSRDGIQMAHGKELNSTTRSEEGRTGCLWNEIETAHLFCYRLLNPDGPWAPAQRWVFLLNWATWDGRVSMFDLRQHVRRMVGILSKSKFRAVHCHSTSVYLKSQNGPKRVGLL
jgi:hypothetical protein